MRTKLTPWLILAALLLACPSRAQFYTIGNDPASAKWYSQQTLTYKVIYPEGLDSLARQYAAMLEYYAGYRNNILSPVGNSSGLRPNQNYRKPMPVILHAYAGYSNGVVTWAPRRLELMTMPDPYAPEPTPWMKQLAVHESRHVSQMQSGSAYPFRWGKYLTGELLAGVLSAIYGGSEFLEGDAVATETALTDGGRGRTADFLEYYRVSFASGDFRNYYRWRYGSQKYYTPDYYRSGYIIHAGVRTLYDTPDFTARYYGRIAEHGPIVFGNLRKTVREISGKKHYTEVFTEACDTLNAEWTRDALSRGPFMNSSTFTENRRWYTEYASLDADNDGNIYAVRSGLTLPYQIVRITPDGKQTALSSIHSYHSKLQYSSADERLYWSEYSSDLRWSLKATSNIYYLDSLGRRHRLTKGHKYFHPAPSPDGKRIAVSEYALNTRTSITILDSSNGEVLESFKLPAGLQAIESVWVDGELYFSALGEYGFGIYRCRDMQAVLPQRRLKIKQLWEHDGKIMFTADHNGVNELYSFEPCGEELYRLTNTEFGAADFTFVRDTLYYSSLTTGGRVIAATAASELSETPADFSQRHSYPFADELSKQERALATSITASQPPSESDGSEYEIGSPERYSKFGHLFRFHSWLPFFVDYDSIADMSFSSLSSVAGLGATAFFQNDLGTAYGYAAYHANYSSTDKWSHRGHFKFTYTGWYPVIELGFHINERNAYTYDFSESESSYTLSLFYRDNPYLRFSAEVYIPFRFNIGSISAGLIPRINYSVGNDYYYDLDDNKSLLSRATLSFNGYIMEEIPDSRIYPRYGIGFEAGHSFRPGLTKSFCPTSYMYLYGYLPGFWQTHGLKLTGMYEHRYDSGILAEAYLNIVPRGFSSLSASAISSFSNRMKFTADYAMPLFPVDWSIFGNFAYIRNFEFTPHADLSLISQSSYMYNLFSAGADLSMRLESLLWIAFDYRIGISYSYKGGSLFDWLAAAERESSRHYIGLIFSVDF